LSQPLNIVPAKANPAASKKSRRFRFVADNPGGSGNSASAARQNSGSSRIGKLVQYCDPSLDIASLHSLLTVA
jgi:hypothetical protein